MKRNVVIVWMLVLPAVLLVSLLAGGGYLAWRTWGAADDPVSDLLTAEATQQLKDSELARAREVWSRKFGLPATEATDRARQMRFLAGRGFSSEVIHRVVQGAVDD